MFNCYADCMCYMQLGVIFSLQVVQKYPEIVKPKFYRFLIYLPYASKHEAVSVLESLRIQHPNFISTTWSQKLDIDTKQKKFGNLGDRDIPKGAVYKLGDRHVLQKEPDQQTFQTKNFKDLYLYGK